MGKGRKSLVEQGFRVAANCKLLGAHVQVSRKHTNATQTARVSTLQPLWPKLKLSAAAYEVKVQAIRAAAWPKGLHAIAATTVSLQTFASLRAGAMKGLNADGAGCNAMVHLGLLECPQTDPHFWSIYQTFKMVRECGIEDVVHPALFALATGDETYANNGITATVLTRIQTFGWHVSSSHCLSDDFGPFNLFSISIAELRWRMEWAWLKVVAAGVSHRPGFSGLWQIDPARTRAWLSKLNCSDRAAYRKILNGAHVTQDGKHYCQEADSDVCQFCDCSDSRFHRFWGCSVFDECRQGVDSDLMVAIPDLPESVTCYGWALRPSTFHSWYSYFLQLVPPVIPEVPWHSQSQFHIFTDGSCCHPQYPDLRFASYAMILVDSSANEHACILESGPLPGLRQTSLRAELFAVHRAIKFAASHGVSLMIWSDCLNVVRRLRRICLGAPVKINSSNADLWSLIADDIHGGGCQVQVTKVAAHQSLAAAASPLEEWCFKHNRFADRAAASANQRRSKEFWNLLAVHSRACQTCDRWNASIQNVLLQVSRHVLHEGRDKPLDDQVHDPPPAPSWTPLPNEPVLPRGAIRWYGDAVVSKMTTWFWKAVSENPGPVQWISNAQLYIDYGLQTGDSGPVHIDGWKDSQDVPLQALRPIGFKERVRWFGKVLREILRHGGLPFSAQYCRPSSLMLCMHSSCIAVPWNPQRLEQVDRWMAKFSSVPFRRQTRELDRLPLPSASMVS